MDSAVVSCVHVRRHLGGSGGGGEPGFKDS